MKERPIILNAEMVRALLDGRKTQTRRPVKGSRAWPIKFVGGKGDFDDPSCWGFEDPNSAEWWLLNAGENENQIPSPFGKIGDRLWVRETFHLSHTNTVTYKADFGSCNPFNEDECGEDVSMVGEKWKPSIHMPRWASRILLEVTDIRVERVQDISKSDCLAEGIQRTDWEYSCEPYRNYHQPKMAPGRNCSTPEMSFCSLWQSIYGDSWDKNEWVWVVDFKLIELAESVKDGGK